MSYSWNRPETYYQLADVSYYFATCGPSSPLHTDSVFVVDDSPRVGRSEQVVRYAFRKGLQAAKNLQNAAIMGIGGFARDKERMSFPTRAEFGRLDVWQINLVPIFEATILEFVMRINILWRLLLLSETEEISLK